MRNTVALKLQRSARLAELTIKQCALFPLGAADCESFAVLGSDCRWYNASATSKPGRALTLTPARWPSSAGKAVGTRAYYANWPVVTAMSVHGVPLLPWVEPLESAKVCPKEWPPIDIPPPPAPTPKPNPKPKPPRNCSSGSVAPTGFTLVGEGWWQRPAYKLVGDRYGSVADCAAACVKFGPSCQAFHVWEPCPVGDCYVRTLTCMACLALSRHFELGACVFTLIAAVCRASCRCSCQTSPASRSILVPSGTRATRDNSSEHNRRIICGDQWWSSSW